MHAYYLSLLREQLAPQGISENQFLAGTGLDAKALSESLTLTPAQLDTVCANALLLSGDPQFGLKLGFTVNMVTQGILGYALLTSANVEAALNLLIRYNRPILPSISIKLMPRNGGMELLVRAPHLPGELERVYTEIFYAAVINNGRILLGDKRVPPSLELGYEPEGGRELYQLLFGDNTRFNSDRTALVFDEESLRVPISGANPVAQEIFRRECDRILAIDSHRGSVSERVQQVFLQAGSQFPNSSAVAKMLNMSESTLQRRLAKEGCRFQQLLDQVRYRLAREYLTGTALSVAEIAELLGFGDTANFRRSFKRWSNTTPANLRKTLASTTSEDQPMPR